MRILGHASDKAGLAGGVIADDPRLPTLLGVARALGVTLSARIG